MDPQAPPSLPVIPEHILRRAAAGARVGLPLSAETMAAMARRRAEARRQALLPTLRIFDLEFFKAIAEFIRAGEFGRTAEEIRAWFDLRDPRDYRRVIHDVCFHYPIGGEKSHRGTLYRWGVIGRAERALQTPRAYDTVKSPKPKRKRKGKDMGKKLPTGANQRAMLSFLEEPSRAGKWFSVVEISETTGVPREAANTALRALRERDEIVYKQEVNKAGKPYAYQAGPRLKVSEKP